MAAGGAIILLLLIAVVWTALFSARLSRQMAPSAEDLEMVESAVSSDEDLAAEDPRYILVLGADRRPGQTRARSDTILIARVDPANQQITMLSIPRDSRVPIEGHGLDKITHANAYGGPALAIATVQAFTGLPIHHYIELDFEGFTTIVDAVGGVTVNVETPINDANGSNTGGVSDVVSIPAGVQRLNAEQALTFVRSRAYADGDFTRIKNQQKFLTALAKEALSSQNMTRLPQVAEAVAGNVQTDMTIPELLSLARSLEGVSSESMLGTTLPGAPETIDGVSYVIPDEAGAREAIEAFRDGRIID